MSSPVLIAMVLTLSVAICSNSAAVDTGGDDGNSTDVVAGRSTRVPTSGHHSETAVTDGNSTDVSATGTWTTQPDEVQSLSPSSRISDVRVPWFRAVSPILIALTTVGNPLSIVTLQNRLFRFDIVISNFCLLWFQDLHCMCHVTILPFTLTTVRKPQNYRNTAQWHSCDSSCILPRCSDDVLLYHIATVWKPQRQNRLWYWREIRTRTRCFASLRQALYSVRWRWSTLVSFTRVSCVTGSASHSVSTFNSCRRLRARYTSTSRTSFARYLSHSSFSSFSRDWRFFLTQYSTIPIYNL